MDVSQTSPGGATLNPLPTTTGTQPVPASQGQYLGHDVTSRPGSYSTPGMAPVYPHASATIAPSTSQLSPARVSAPGGATGSGAPTGQPGISVVVNEKHVVVDKPGSNLYTVKIGDSNTKPPISYLNLAALAVCQHPGKKASIKQITSWVRDNIPYYTENYKELEMRIRDVLNLHRLEFQEKTEGSGKSQVRLWRLNHEEAYFQSAGPNRSDLSKRDPKKYLSLCCGSLPAPGTSPFSFDTTATHFPAAPQHHPAIASAPGIASSSGASTRQQRISIEIGLSNIFIKGADGRTLHTVTKGDTDTKASTSQLCLIAMAICDHRDKKASTKEIVSWIKLNIPYYANDHDDVLMGSVGQELYTHKHIFQNTPFSASKKTPYNWQLLNEVAFFQGLGTTPPTFRITKKRRAKSQPSAAKKSPSQLESERSAGPLLMSDVPMGGYLQPPPPYSFPEGHSTASSQPTSTGPIPPLPHPFSWEYPMASFHPRPVIPPSHPQGYPGVSYQPAEAGSYRRPPSPPYPFSGGGPVSYPQSFLGTADPMLSAASVGFPYDQQSGPYPGSTYPPYYPPIVVTTTNS